MWKSVKGLWEYVNAKDEAMLKEVGKKNILQEGETKVSYQNKLHEQRVAGFENKSLHGKLRSSAKEVADERSWE